MTSAESTVIPAPALLSTIFYISSFFFMFFNLFSNTILPCLLLYMYQCLGASVKQHLQSRRLNDIKKGAWDISLFSDLISITES